LNLSYQQQGPRAGGSGGIWVGKRDAVRDVFDHDQDVFSERSEVMRVLMTVIVSLTLAPVALAHDLFIFPSNGQSQDQQDQDEFQCMRAATRQSGFDPMQTPTAATRPPETQGGVGQGALRGALLGTAVGAATGNTRQGARAGAVGGGLLGGMRRADSNAQQDQWAREQVANYQRDRNNWNRAFTACMESRGYTVR
jgi:uncharacterized protein YcfJ